LLKNQLFLVQFNELGLPYFVDAGLISLQASNFVLALNHRVDQSFLRILEVVDFVIEVISLLLQVLFPRVLLLQ
jgi:hypothetical protein